MMGSCHTGGGEAFSLCFNSSKHPNRHSTPHPSTGYAYEHTFLNRVDFHAEER